MSTAGQLTPTRHRSPAPQARARTPVRPPPAEDNNFHTIAMMMATSINTHFTNTPKVHVASGEAPLIPCAYCGLFAARTHQAKCPKRPMQCPDCRKVDLTAASLPAHTVVCPMRNVNCPGCSNTILRSELSAHILSSCAAKRFRCAECEQIFATPSEYISHAVPRCQAGFVACQLCNELVNSTTLAQHYVTCAQRNLTQSVAVSSLHAPVKHNVSVHSKSPVSLLSLHNQVTEQQVRARNSRAQHRHIDALLGENRGGAATDKGFMASTRSSSTRAVNKGEDLFSPVKVSLYINRPLTPRGRAPTPSRVAANASARKPPPPQAASTSLSITNTSAIETAASLGDAGDVDADATDAAVAHDSMRDEDHWLTGRNDDDDGGEGGAVVSHVDEVRSTTSPLPQLRDTGDGALDGRSLSSPAVPNPNRSEISRSPNRSSKVNTAAVTTHNASRLGQQQQNDHHHIHQIHTVHQTPIVRAPTEHDKTINHNIVGKSPKRLDFFEAGGSDLSFSERRASNSSRAQLQNAMDRQLLPRAVAPPSAAAAAGGVYIAAVVIPTAVTRDEVPLTHIPLSSQKHQHHSRDNSPSFAKEGEEDGAGIRSFADVGSPRPALGGSIPRSISPHHSFNSFSQRQKVHKQANTERSRIGMTPPRAADRTAARASTPGKHHKFTRPLSHLSSEVELRADPRFDQLSRREQDALLKDVRLKTISAKALQVARDRTRLQREEDLKTEEQKCHGMDALLMSANTSSGAMRSMTPPARSQGGRPFQL